MCILEAINKYSKQKENDSNQNNIIKQRKEKSLIISEYSNVIKKENLSIDEVSFILSHSDFNNAECDKIISALKQEASKESVVGKINSFKNDINKSNQPPNNKSIDQ